jgi:hypothetical protein
MVFNRRLTMSNTNFTQGDWQVRVDQIVPSSKAESFVVVTDEFDIISPSHGIRNESDANLIAAAPKMYAALDEAVKDLVAYQFNARMAAKSDSAWVGVSEILQPSVDMARSALAKARGE